MRESRSRHRVTASALERGQQQQITYEQVFSDWIFTVSEFSVEAEHLLALEIELARSFGVTWEQVASALGVSRQAAWARFSDPSRWQKSRRVSQQKVAHRTEILRELHQQIEASDEEELVAMQDWLYGRARGTR